MNNNNKKYSKKSHAKINIFEGVSNPRLTTGLPATPTIAF